MIDAILPSHHPDYILLRTITTRQNRPHYDFVVLSVTGMMGLVDKHSNSTDISTGSGNAAPITIALNDGSITSTDAVQVKAPNTETVINSDAPTTTTRDDNTASIIPIDLDPSIHRQVKNPIGILPDGRLVFTDRNLWICTALLPFLSPPAVGTSRRVNNSTRPVSNQVKRHFFLPHDWVTASGLRLCRVLRDGTVLCPSKGEVAVIRADLV